MYFSCVSGSGHVTWEQADPVHAVRKEDLDNPVLTTRNVLAAAVPPNHASQGALGLQRILSVKILKTNLISFYVF